MIIKLTTGILGYIVLVLLTICFCIIAVTKTLNFLSKSFVGVPLSETCHRLVEKDKPKEIEKQESQYVNTVKSYSISRDYEKRYFIETIDCQQYLFSARDLNNALDDLRNYTTENILFIEELNNEDGVWKTVYSYGNSLEKILKQQ